MVFQITCFKAVGHDLIMEKIKQVDFRESQTARLMEQYLNSLSLKALYWQQELNEKVAQDVAGKWTNSISMMSWKAYRKADQSE